MEIGLVVILCIGVTVSKVVIFCKVAGNYLGGR